MSILGEVARWFADPAHWQGPHGIPIRILEHIQYSGVAIVIALVIALPVALYLGHTGRGGFIAINVANVGRALPSFALIGVGLIIAIPLGLGLGFWPTMFALVPLAIPPIVTNTFVAIREIDRDVVEAARGMGLAEGQILRSIEIPLGLPLILAGVRTAAVNVVATATLGAVIAGGALGRFIVDGFALREYDQLVAGGILVALLAVATEVSFSALERASAPPGMATIR
jgi:osmoprotectant transport system permease protein